MIRAYDLAASALRRLPAETAHNLTLRALANGMGPRAGGSDPDSLSCEIWGRRFANPVGMAAGFDKNAVAIAGVRALGFGFHEVGGLTPIPQAGNRRPRLFRLPSDRALINRMGLNNDGLELVAARLAEFRQTAAPSAAPLIVGANLAANSDSADAIDDFVRSAVRLADLVDFLTIDISCPNTEDGRQFLSPGPLAALLAALDGARTRQTAPPARLVKLSPDIDDDRLRELLDIIAKSNIDGMIVANTTTARPEDLISAHATERGGLSGPPLMAPSTRMLGVVYRETGGSVPLIGVGGIASGRDAYAKIRAGASLVQLYTGLVYEGPGLIGRIKRDLAQMLAKNGFENIAQAVGADHK